MKHFFSTRVRIVLVVAILLAAVLAVISNLTGLSIPDMVVKGILTPIRTGASRLTDQAERLYNYMFQYDTLQAENAALKEELANMLFLEPPKVDLREETKAIISYMKALFPSEDSDNPISHLGESDKAFILESYIEKKLTEVIKRNVLGYYKVSTEMDSDIYKAVCR